MISKQQLYERLANVENARACKAISEDACKEVPNNYFKLIAAQTSSGLADALLNPKITLTWLAQSIGVPAAFIGWLVPIRESGSMLPQLIIASFIRKLPVRKWVWVGGAIVQCLCILALIAIAMTMTGAQAGYAIIGTIIAFSLARGFNSIASKDVLGKVIPKAQRGALSGLSSSLCGFATLVFALVLYFNPSDYDNNSALIALWFSAALWVVAAFYFSRVQEYEGATSGGKNGFMAAMAKLSLLYKHKSFGHFVLTRALLLSSALAAPYYVLQASTQDNSMTQFALFLGLSGAASLLSAPFWGRFSDVNSKYVLIIAAVLVTLNGFVLYAVSELQPQWLQPIYVIPVFYFFLSIAYQGVRLGRKTYVVDMAEGDMRTDYVSVSNTVIGILLLVFGAAGMLLSQLGNYTIILMYSGLSLAGAVSALFLKKV